MAEVAPLRALRPTTGEAGAWVWPLDRMPTWTAGDVQTALATGALRRDAVPALYRYELSFGPPEERRHATAVLALLGHGDGRGPEPLEPPVVLRYADPRGWVDEVLHSNAFDEVARLTTDGGEHRVWRVDRPEGVGEVVAQFEDRVLRPERGVLRPGTHLVLLVPEGPPVAPWLGGLVMAMPDEPRPLPWRERVTDPGRPERIRRPS